MHYLIKLVVDADDAKEALSQAESYAEELVEQGEFDWFQLDGRWGNAEAHEVTSEKGKELLDEGMKSTRHEFDRAMDSVRYMVEHFTDDEIYAGEMPYNAPETDGLYLSRYMFSVADGRGNSVYVFAQGWGKIENDKELEMSIKGDSRKSWVVPVDFHN